MKRAALLLLAGALVLIATAPPIFAHGPGGRDVALVYVLDGVPFERALEAPELRALAAGGGVALMTTLPEGDEDRERAAYLTVLNGIREPEQAEASLLERALLGAAVTFCRHEELLAPTIEPCSRGRTLGEFDHAVVFDARNLGSDATSLREVGRNALDWLRSLPGHHALVVIVSPLPSAEMDRMGDEVTPVIVAESSIARSSTMDAFGELRALASDTTRRDGLVAAVDVAPTVLGFFGFPIPEEMEGNPVAVSERAAPFTLHRKHLEQRAIRLPIQLGELGFVVLAGMVSLPVLAWMATRRRVSPRVAGLTRFVILSAVALGLSVAAGGLLPRLTPPWVVPFLVLATAALAVMAATSRWPGPMGPLAFLGAAGVAFLVLDLGFFEGRALAVPLLGGTMFDGVRFYGLPNALIALPLAGGLFVAAMLRPFEGFVLLLGLGLIAGFPALGANVGASVTLFAAAGLWWVVRTRLRFRIREAAFAAGVTALGLAGVLLANRWLPGAPSHAGRFLDRSGEPWEEALEAVGERLAIGVSMIEDVPAAVIPLIGLVVVLAAALRPLGLIARGLAVAGEPWRHAVAVLAGSSLVAFFANDTGVAAAAPGFLYAAAALVYPSFLPEAMAHRSGIEWQLATAVR